MNNELYNDEYHVGRDDMTRCAASIVINQLLKIMRIESAIDLGGAIGVWIDELKRQVGNSFKYGCVVDGDYIKEEMKLVSQEEYIIHDLEERFVYDSTFDIAISLETAEHLTPERAGSFVEDLTRLSDVVLFSAGIPVGEAEDPLNERPISYWAELFSQNGYKAFDIIRPRIQYIQSIPWWYRNDMLLYCKKESPIISSLEKMLINQPVFDGVVEDEYECRVACSKELRKVLRINDMLGNWVALHQKGICISEYLFMKGYKTVAIYGMGMAGKLLLSDIQNSKIYVSYGVDINADNIVAGIDIFYPNEKLPEVDLVIVTAITYFDEIKEMLEQKMECTIICLENLLVELKG